MDEPVSGCCKFLLFFVAIWCPPLSIIFYDATAHNDICDHTFHINAMLYIGAILCGWIIAFINPTRESARMTLYIVYILGVIAGILSLAATIHAIITVCPCDDQEKTRRYPNTTNALGKPKKRRGGGTGRAAAEEEAMPKNLNVQSSYMICDCRGQKAKNGLVKLRVPRKWVRNRKAPQEDPNLSSDESFEDEREEMRKSMMPYVGKGNHERGGDTDTVTTDDEIHDKDGRREGKTRARRDSAVDV